MNQYDVYYKQMFVVRVIANTVDAARAIVADRWNVDIADVVAILE